MAPQRRGHQGRHFVAGIVESRNVGTANGPVAIMISRITQMYGGADILATLSGGNFAAR